MRIMRTLLGLSSGNRLRDRLVTTGWAALLAAALVTIVAPVVRADVSPRILPPAPRQIVIWHCGQDVTTGRAVLVHRGGRHYDVVAAKGAPAGKIVARCVTVPAPPRVVN